MWAGTSHDRVGIAGRVEIDFAHDIVLLSSCIVMPPIVLHYLEFAVFGATQYDTMAPFPPEVLDRRSGVSQLPGA